MSSLCLLATVLLSGFVCAASGKKYVVEVLLVVDSPVTENYHRLGYRANETYSLVVDDINRMIFAVNQYMSAMEKFGLYMRFAVSDLAFWPQDVLAFHPHTLINGTLNLKVGLRFFQLIVQNDKRLLDTHYDAIVLLTGHKAKTGGSAMISEICNKASSMAIVQFRGIQADAHAFAHELLHVVGAKHDSDTKNCSHQTGYLMHYREDAKLRNKLDVTKCTVDSVMAKLSQLDAQNKNCLIQTRSKIRGTFKYTSPHGADSLDPEKICQRLYRTKDAYFCNYMNRILNYQPVGDDVCKYIGCARKYSLQCTATSPTDGMPCNMINGTLHRCSKGKCIKDWTSYPAPKYIQEGCVFGDLQGGIIGNQKGTTCTEYLEKYGENKCREDSYFVKNGECCRACSDVC